MLLFSTASCTSTAVWSRRVMNEKNCVLSCSVHCWYSLMPSPCSFRRVRLVSLNTSQNISSRTCSGSYEPCTGLGSEAVKTLFSVGCGWMWKHRLLITQSDGLSTSPLTR